ncbi:MAG: 50S ribosomal protein L31 [Anaerolineae bacterium]|nr:50S ribosomal protein L31 [Anaerolineae bacterium]
MRKDIHPKYYPEAQVICACGNTWNVGATIPLIRTDVCSACHPFFTGEQRIVDTEGQVDRFMSRLRRRDEILADEVTRRESVRSPDQPIGALELGTRAEGALAEAGITTVAHALQKLAEGDETLTNLRGFGLKSLATLKKRLRARGFVLPGDESLDADEDLEETED